MVGLSPQFDDSCLVFINRIAAVGNHVVDAFKELIMVIDAGDDIDQLFPLSVSFGSGKKSENEIKHHNI